MEDITVIAFKIIAEVGSARSNFIEAIRYAKKNDFKQAETLMTLGSEYLVKGHKEHLELLQKEALKEDFQVSLMLVHAEDQLMSAETFKLLSEEFIDVYKKINENDLM